MIKHTKMERGGWAKDTYIKKTKERYNKINMTTRKDRIRSGVI